MPTNIQALALLLVFIVPGFLFVEVDTRRRPAQKLGAFDKTILSILFSTLLHAAFLFLILAVLRLFEFDLATLLDGAWFMTWIRDHLLLSYVCILLYSLVCLGMATLCGISVGTITRTWTPVLSRVVRRDKANPVLVQMKNGDYYTGILGMIPADYDVLQSPAKDFTIRPPGRYKPNGQGWQNLQEAEVIVLNTSNVDAIRFMWLSE